MDNINEEIERIKSLFTEDRLYGNLINESCASCTEQEMEDELESKGYSVYKRGKTDSDCLTTIGSTPHLKCVKAFFDGDSDWSGNYEVFEWKNGCVIHGVISNKALPFASTRKGKIILTVYEKGTFMSNQKTFAITLEVNTPFDLPKTTHFTEKNYEGIKKFQIRGIIDDSCNIKDLYMVMIEDKDGKNTTNTKMINTINQLGTINKLFKLK